MSSQPISRHQLAQEITEVLSARGVEEFSPGELIPQLSRQRAWHEYLHDRSLREQAAIVGRFLAANGILPVRRDRDRGSLYSQRPVLKHLAEEPQPQEYETFLAGMHLVERKAEPSPSLAEAAAASAVSTAPALESGVTPAAARKLIVNAKAEPAAGGSSERHAEAAAMPAFVMPTAAAPGNAAHPFGWIAPAGAASAASAALPYNPMLGAPGAGMVSAGWPGSGLALPGGLYENVMEGAEGGRRELPLAFYGQQIRRHWIKVLAMAVVITVLVGIHMRRIPKEYGSTATVRISASLAGNNGLTNSGYSGDYLDNLQTLMATIMSDVVTPSVVNDSIRVGKLDRDRALNPAGKPLSQDELAGLVSGAISVSAVPNTRNFQINAVAGNPAAAADIANAMAQGLIEHEFQTRLRAVNRSNDWMRQQLGELKAKLERSQQKLLDYQHRKALLNPDDQDKLMQQRMLQINNELGTIQAERFRYEADRNAVQGNSLSALLTTSIAQSTIGQELAAALTQQQTAQAAFEAIKLHDGPANPAYIQAQQRMTVANQQLRRMRDEATAQIQTLYQKALDQETLLRRALQSGQIQQANFNSNALDYNLLKQEEKNNQDLYNALQQQFDAANLTASFHGEMLRVVNPATPNPAPVYPNVRREVMLAFLMSLLGGCMLAIGIGYLDRSLKTPEDVTHMGANFLGSLPLSYEAITVRKPFSGGDEASAPAPSAFEEAVLSLRTALMLSPGAVEARTFTITSSTPGEGKSTILAHLAIAMSLHGVKTLLLDAELRRPQMHRLLDVANRQGVSDILRGVAETQECILPTAFNNLWVLPSGGRIPNPSQLLHTGLSPLLEQLKKEYQVIFIDTPPLLGFSETLLVDSLVDMVMMVVLAGKTKREQVRATLQQLRRVRANVIGVVLNQVVQGMSPYYSHYDRGYYAYSREDATEEHV